VLVAKDLVGDEPFAVLLGDVLIPGGNPATKQLIDVYAATGVGAIAVEEVPKEKTHLYGIVDGEPAPQPPFGAVIEDPRSGGKAQAGKGAIKSGDYRALRVAAADF